MKKLHTIMFAILFVAACKNTNQKNNIQQPQQTIDPRFGHEYYPVPIGSPDWISTGNIEMNLPIDSIVMMLMSRLDTFYDPRLAPEIEAVRKKESFYRKYLKSAFKDAQGVRVDLVTQKHITSDPNIVVYGVPPDVASSQLMIKSILDSMKYDVISWETSSDEEVTRISWMEEQWANMEYMGYKPVHDSAFFMKLKPKDVLDDAVLERLFEDSTAHIIGNQDKELWRLNLATKKYYDFNSPLAFTMVWFRSYMALAKMLNQMKKHHYKSGAVVLGALHAYDFRVMAMGLGLNMRIWNTTNEKLNHSY